MSSPESSPAESSSLESLDASPPMFSFGQGVERTRDEPEWKSGGVARRTHTTPAKKDTRLIPSSQRRKSTEDDKIERYRETKAQQYEAYKKNVELKKQMKAIDEEHEYRMRTGRSLAPTTSEKKKKKPSYLYRKVEQYIGNPNEVADLMLFLGLGGFAWGVVHPESFTRFTQNFLPGFLQRTISKFISPEAAKALEESFKRDETTSITMTEGGCSNQIAQITNDIHNKLQDFLSNIGNTPRESIIDYLKNISTSGELLNIKSLLRQCTKLNNDDYKKLTEIVHLVEYTYGPITFATTYYEPLFRKLKLKLENESNAPPITEQATEKIGEIDISNTTNISSHISTIKGFSYDNILNIIHREVQTQNPSENDYLKLLLVCCCALEKHQAQDKVYFEGTVLYCLVEIIKSTNSLEIVKLTYLVCCSNFLPSLNIIIERYLNTIIEQHVSGANKETITKGIVPRICKSKATTTIDCSEQQITDINAVFSDTGVTSFNQKIIAFVEKADAFICNGKGSIYHLMLKALLSSPNDVNMHVHKALFLQKIQQT
jgi:hypothetical protein